MTTDPKHLKYSTIGYDLWLKQHASDAELNHNQRMEYFLWNLCMQFQDAHPPGLPDPGQIIDREIKHLEFLIIELSKSKDSVNKGLMDKFEFAIAELKQIKNRLITPTPKQ